MTAKTRSALALSLVLWPAIAGAAGPPPAPMANSVMANPMPAVHADRWADAEALAAHYADPVAAKLVTYYRLLAPGAATAQEIAAFVASSPDWPAQGLLERRWQEAIASDPDDASVLAQCNQDKVTLPGARLRCANALANAGHNAEAAAEATRAWITGFANDPASFPQRWRSVLTPSDQWARFQALALSDPAAAARQATLLEPPDRTIAEARLALQRDDPAAAALLAAVQPRLANANAAVPGSIPGNAAANYPEFMLDEARWLRRAGRTQDAVALWRADGLTAQQAASPAALPGFWAERERLARQLLQSGNAADAYALVNDPGPIARTQTLDADFLAGFIALRMLHQPVEATRHFQALAGASPAALTQSRAWYWLGRAAAATGQDPRPAYTKAAAWTTTLYGQLAAVALDDDPAALAARIDALHDPQGTREQAFGLTQRQVVRAAALLVAWGEPRRAETFLLRMDELAPDLPDRALTAQLAQWLGQPQAAVAIARRMGRDGFMLPEAGWPTPFEPPRDAVDPAIVLGLIRQESSFDTDAISPAGARGLMQLMPATAATLARQIGTTVSPVALTFEPEQNMRLGTAYVYELLERFDNALPLALAAYNAGPHRVAQWLVENGDPRGVPTGSALAGAADNSPGSAAGGTPASTTGSNPAGAAGGGQAGIARGPPAGASGGGPTSRAGDAPASNAGDAPATAPQTITPPLVAPTAASSPDMIDWIELIPFSETRNYVQRVLENVVIYRARSGEATPTLLAQWTR